MPPADRSHGTIDTHLDCGDLFNDAPLGIFYSTAEGRLLRANPALAAMLGYVSPEEMVISVTDLGSQVYAEPHRRAEIVAAMLVPGGWLHEEVSMQRKDGSLITVLMKGRKIPGADGHIACLEGYLIDISARVAAELQVREYEERWKALDQVGVVMLYYNVGTGMIHFSNSWKRMLGYADHEIANWLPINVWHAMLHPDERADIESAVRADIDAGVSFSNTVHRVRCKEGGYKWVHLLGTFLRRDATGRAACGAGVLTDITGLRETLSPATYAPYLSGIPATDVWILDLAACHVAIPGYESLRLTAKEFQFISLLAGAVPRPLTRDDAASGIYGRYDEYTSRSLDVLIARLRKKVETLTSDPFPLQTLYGMGFIFTAPLISR